MGTVNIAFVQASLFWQNHAANLSKFKQIIESLSDDTGLVILPEMFLTGFVVNPEPNAISQDSAEIKELQKLSAIKNLVISGSVIIKEKNQFYNRFLWISPDGSISYYDKRHLFTYGGEDKNFNAGNSLKTFNLKGIKFRPLICYDLRFPVWSRNRFSKEHGYEYDVLIYTANWPSPRSQVWSALLKARAIENQCFVLGVNRVGTDGEGLNYSGDSVLFNARGEVMAKAEASKELVINATIDLAELNSFREKFAVGPDWDDFTIH
ncbi:MAG: amidohydrolase [Marinilabiliales bacterium]|nr:MAG: amidohydrolase [Marinilabiliales bacterium]